MKAKECTFCDKVIKFTEQDSHYQQCGSKTYQCDTCKDYVKLMNKASHIKNNACKQVMEKNKAKDDDE